MRNFLDHIITRSISAGEAKREALFPVLNSGEMKFVECEEAVKRPTGK